MIFLYVWVSLFISLFLAFSYLSHAASPFSSLSLFTAFGLKSIFSDISMPNLAFLKKNPFARNIYSISSCLFLEVM
jgi:hypothetical protein